MGKKNAKGFVLNCFIKLRKKDAAVLSIEEQSSSGGNEDYFINNHVDPGYGDVPGEPKFNPERTLFTKDKNGMMIARLNGYAIIPKEEYEELVKGAAL